MAAKSDLIIPHLQPRLDTFLTELGQLSAMECGTYDKEGVDAVGRVLHERLRAAHAEVAVHRDGTFGDSLVARWRGKGSARLLLIGHLDTVYPPGWTVDHPFGIDGDAARRSEEHTSELQSR